MLLLLFASIFIFISCENDEEVFVDFNNEEVAEIISLVFLEEHGGVEYGFNYALNWVRSQEPECYYDDKVTIDTIIRSEIISTTYNVTKNCNLGSDSNYDYGVFFRSIEGSGLVQKDDLIIKYDDIYNGIDIYGTNENGPISFNTLIEEEFLITTEDININEVEGSLYLTLDSLNINLSLPYDRIFDVRILLDYIKEGYNGFKVHKGKIFYDNDSWYFRNELGDNFKL